MGAGARDRSDLTATIGVSKLLRTEDTYALRNCLNSPIQWHLDYYVVACLQHNTYVGAWEKTSPNYPRS